MLIRDIFSFGEISLLSEGNRWTHEVQSIFSEAERPNGNKRVYNRPLLARSEEASAQDRSRQLLGELTTPRMRLFTLETSLTLSPSFQCKVIRDGRGEVLNTPLEKFFLSF